MEEHAISVKKGSHIPLCIQMGLQAAEKGDFETARKMFRSAIKQSIKFGNSSTILAKLAIYIATTYFNEARYGEAETWYQRALHIVEHLYGKTTMQGACLLIKLAELNVLQSKLSNYEKLFERAQHIYISTDETDTNTFLNWLVDLSWTLCVARQASEVRYVNDLVHQIQKAHSFESPEHEAGAMTFDSISSFIETQPHTVFSQSDLLT